MARAIPTYQRRFMAEGVQGKANAQSAVTASSPGAQALMSIGEGLGVAANAYEQRQQRELESRNAIETANVLSGGEVFWQEDLTRRTQEWSPGAPDMREGISKDFDKWVGENEQKLTTDAAKNYFRQHAVGMRTRMLTNAFSYQEKATTAKLNADTTVGVQADENIVFADPSRFDDVLRRRGETILARKDLTDAEKMLQADVLKRKLSLSVERGQMERDPLEWYRARFGEPPQAADVTRATPSTGASAIADAIYGQESNSGQANTSGVNSQNVTGPMQMQEGTFNGMKKMGLIPADYNWKDAEQNKAAGYKWVDYLANKYQGDPAKVAAAYYGGEKAVGEDGEIKRSMKNLQRPSDPTVGEYVDQVLGRMGSAPAPVAAKSGEAAPAPVPPRSFEMMDWEQKSALRAQAEGKIKQNETKIMASVVGNSADVAVAAQDIGADRNIDIARAKLDALAAAKTRLGRDLDDVQQSQVEAAVERAASVRERDRRRAQENTAQSVFDMLDKNGGDYQAVRAAMPGQLASLPRDMDQRAQKYAGQVALGETRETDWIAYSQLVENPQVLLSVNLAAMRDKFGASEYAQLVKMQETGKKAAESGMPDQTIQGDMAVVKSMLGDAGIKSKTKEAQFFSVLQREMDARRATTGQKALRQEDVKSIAADLLVREVTSKGVLWDTKTEAFLIEVPDAERAKIAAALTTAGLPVNDSTILRAYRNKLSRTAVPPPPTAAAPVAPYSGDWYGGAGAAPVFNP